MGIKFTGLNRGTSALNNAEKRVKDFRPIFRQLQPDVAKIFDEKFKNQGPGWQRHSGATTLIHGSHKILHLTGRLRRSLTKKGSTGSRWRITRTRLTHATTLKYAKAMDEGFVQSITPAMRGWFRGRGINISPNRQSIRVPARQFTGILPRQVRMLQEKAQKLIQKQVNSA